MQVATFLYDLVHIERNPCYFVQYVNTIRILASILALFYAY